MNLYERTIYTNKNIQYLVSNEINEYDMRSAGLSLSKEYSLLPLSDIERIENLSNKLDRSKALGYIQKDNPVYKKKLSEAFVDMRRRFFEANNLQDSSILSIKKDAIFTLRTCPITQFGEVEFVHKNSYTSYYYINNMEMYLGDKCLDIKGISDDKLIYHQKYMIDFLIMIFKMMEVSNYYIVRKKLVSFIDTYKRYKLESGYYRELNNESIYRLKDMYMINGHSMTLTDIVDPTVLDISYNYMNYLVPLINLLI